MIMALVNTQQLTNLALDLGPRIMYVAGDPTVQRDAVAVKRDVQRAARSVAVLGKSVGGAWRNSYRVPTAASVAAR